MAKNPFDWLNENKWTTREGATLTPGEMGTEHIHNVLRLMERRADLLVSQYYDWMVMNSAYDVDADELMENLAADPVEWLRKQPIYRYMVAELEKRGVSTAQYR